MPTVAVIDAVRIRFFFDEHPPPHFHAVFAEYQVQIGIEPLRVLKGSLPPAKLAAVVSWAALRKEVLLNTWYTVREKKKPAKIL